MASAGASPLGALLPALSIKEDLPAPGLKTSLNAYSFNALLMNGTMSLDDLLDFTAREGFDAIDITGYYFKGYPSVPANDTLFLFKRRAHALGLAISGTGIRTDFTNPDPALRNKDVELVKNWIPVAAKLGAPVLRIFAGLQYPPAGEREAINQQIAAHIRECIPVAASHGVILGLQNHHDFIKTADEAIRLIELVPSPWFGVVLDTGSYRGTDPFSEISKTIPYAVNWQIKENMYVNNREKPTDLARLCGIIKNSRYKGYLPIETLGAGDPFLKVPAFLKAFKSKMM